MTTESVIDDASDRAPGRTDLPNRGRTVIDDRVRRKLIEHAVLSVPGTERSGGLASRQFPAVRFTDASRTEVEVHLVGPGPLRRVESLTHHHHSLIAAKGEEDLDALAAKALAVPWSPDGTRRDASLIVPSPARAPARRAPAAASAG